MGIITSGIAFNYLQENYQDKKCPYPIVKITQYPLPLKYINKLADECDSLMLIEEGYPLIEQQIKGLLNRGLKVKGRLDGSIPRVGELNANIIARALGLPDTQGEAVPDIVVPRPPALCTGCPHTDTYKALNEAIEPYGKGRVFADIGCYTLGALPPHNAIFTCVDMGASITMAKGATDAGLNQAVAVIGDSTFCHSGITSLFDCVMENTPLTVFILDNSTTAMTGGQKSHASGKIENICLGLGVDKDHIHVIKPLPKEHDKNVEIIAKELKHQGVSVIIPERECIQTLKRKTRTQK
jgi:indolepyruvate ferredoxin oxidoreductase alpha subunit